MPISHPVQVKPFGNCNPVTKCDNESTSFVSTPKQPLAPPSMQGLSGSNSGLRPSHISGLVRPL
jgi:hypothetical protein